MSILYNALPSLGQVLLVAVLLTLMSGRLVKDKQLHRVSVAILLSLGMFVPVYGLTFAQWLRSVVGDLSVLSLVIFSNILAQRLFNLKLLEASARNTLLAGVALVGVVFYPLALGVSAFDPYRLGYAPVLMSAVLSIFSIYAWLKINRLLAIILLLPLLAFNLHLLESTNLWDYLIDPILLIYALTQLLVNNEFLRFKQMRAWFGK